MFWLLSLNVSNLSTQPLVPNLKINFRINTAWRLKIYCADLCGSKDASLLLVALPAATQCRTLMNKLHLCTGVTLQYQGFFPKVPEKLAFLEMKGFSPDSSDLLAPSVNLTHE